MFASHPPWRLRGALRPMLLAVATVLGATAAKLAAGSWLAGDVNLVYLTAVAVAAWGGGFRAGAAATMFAALVELYLFIPPAGLFAFQDPTTAVHLAVSTVESLLVCVMFRALERARMRALDLAGTLEQKVVERTAALAASEAAHRLLFEGSPVPMLVFDAQTLRFVEVNDAAAALYGYARATFEGMSVLALRPLDEQPRLESDLRGLASDWSGLVRHRTSDGRTIDVELTTRALVLEGRSVQLCLAIDVTEQLRAQEQTARLEAIGRLAGGVAHDFNNILSVISMCADLALDDVMKRSSVQESLEDIAEASKRAAALTRQLLAFSKHELLERRELHLNEAVRNMEKLLRRLLGEHVDLRVDLAAESDAIFADPSQIEQIVVNLAVNARDAMPKGGTLLITTAKSDDADRINLVVRDTGSGIDEATRARIFDPFFSTKPRGKGTGLGLATVMRIVRASDATIDVESEVGHGTAFVVGFPIVAARPVEAPAANDERPRGHETILLAEDDDDVREATSALLKRQGYSVIEAGDGAEALAICERPDEPIDLLLTDVMMPKLDGPELARRVALVRPEMPVICMSGYTGEAAVDDLEARGVMLIHKPLMPDAITRTLRTVLTAAQTKKNPGKDHSFPGPSSLHLP